MRFHLVVRLHSLNPFEGQNINELRVFIFILETQVILTIVQQYITKILAFCQEVRKKK